MDNSAFINTQVAIRHTGTGAYPAFPYHPPRRYPEFSAFDMQIDETNHVYEAVRNVLADLQLDRNNFDHSSWNPLGSFIKSGQRALIKPNWVLHVNKLDGSIESLVTHTSLIRVMIDYLILALDQEGTIEIADAPLQGCDFAELLRRNLVMELLEEYKRQFPTLTFTVLDLRKTILSGKKKWFSGFEKQTVQRGDPRGYALVDLGRASFLSELKDKFQRFRVTEYDYRQMLEHHNEMKHEYLVANSILSADFIVNLPKLKCHMKAGITGALKNLVGINGHKEYLPHHTSGCPAMGGDQYQHSSALKPFINRLYDDHWSKVNDRGTLRNILEANFIRVLRFASKLLDKDHNFEGSWSGNDTIPRTTLDLNHLLYFHDPDTGEFSTRPLRNLLHVVDGVIAGEGYGPLTPTSKAAGVVLGGWNPLLVDVCGARLIGFDPMKVRLLRYGFSHERSRFSVPLASLWDFMVTVDGELKPLTHVPNSGFTIPSEWKNAAV